MHYVIPMRSTEKDPTNNKDMATWFYFYKWAPGEEDQRFFPVSEAVLPTTPQEGDTLWFIMDERVVGKVPVLYSILDESNCRLEIWYDCACAVPLDIPVSCKFDTPSRMADVTASKLEEMINGQRANGDSH
jgi:hypothetical protein